MFRWLWRKQATEKRGDIESQTGWKNHRIILRHCSIHFPLRASFVSLRCSMWWDEVLPVTKWKCGLLYLWCVLYWDEMRLRLLRHVYCALMVTLVATANYFNATKSPGKWMLFSSEHGSIVTGKAWGFSVLLFFFLLLTNHGPMHLLLLPPSLPLSPPSFLPTLNPALWLLSLSGWGSLFLLLFNWGMWCWNDHQGALRYAGQLAWWGRHLGWGDLDRDKRRERWAGVAWKKKKKKKKVSQQERRERKPF